VGRKKLPDFGTCEKCGRYIKLHRKGKRPCCRNCYEKERNSAICSNCGKLRRIQGKGVCHYCYYSLGYSNKIIICEKCGKRKYYYAKGLCRLCYNNITGKRWRKKNPKKYNESHNKAFKKWKAENPEKWKEIERKANEKRRKTLKELLPKRIKQTIKNVSFVTSDGVGCDAGKLHAKCVFVSKFDENDKRIIVYEMPPFRYELEKRKFKVQIIDIRSKKETFENLNGKEILEKYAITKDMFIDYQNRQVFGGHGTYSN
jgi:hypothetical protein